MSDNIQWWYGTAQREQVAVSQEELQALIYNGTITPDTYIWRDGMESWVLLKDCDEFHSQAYPSYADTSPELCLSETTNPISDLFTKFIKWASLLLGLFTVLPCIPGLPAFLRSIFAVISISAVAIILVSIFIFFIICFFRSKIKFFKWCNINAFWLGLYGPFYFWVLIGALVGLLIYSTQASSDIGKENLVKSNGIFKTHDIEEAYVKERNDVPSDIVCNSFSSIRAKASAIFTREILKAGGDCSGKYPLKITNQYSQQIDGETWYFYEYTITFYPISTEQKPEQIASGTLAFVKRGNSWYTKSI